MKAKLEGRELWTALRVTKPRPSTSGKSMVVATTHGAKKTSVTVNDKPIYVVATAFFYLRTATHRL